MEESQDIEKRKKQIFDFVKQKVNWIYYIILGLILSLSVFIRTRNIPKLKDITTGTWTLGPDLDPFLFLRWAKYIAEHGKLFLMDTMRYVPLADFCQGTQCNPINTAGEMKLLSYLIAGLSKILEIFNSESTVTYAAIIFPVIFAVLTGIAFFLLARKIFEKQGKKISSIIALVSTLFFVLIPSLLPRTIAGIPEKESAAFFFIFIGLYFFLEAITTKDLKKGLIFSALAGISTGLLGLTWGGGVILILIISSLILFEFLFGKMDKQKILKFILWEVIFIAIFMIFSTRYTPLSLIVSASTGLTFMITFILILDLFLFRKKIFGLDKKLKKIKLPTQIISFLIAIGLILILTSTIFGLDFIPGMIRDTISETVNPINLNRFTVTVAENAQPYFDSDWAGEFGPNVLEIPIYFWMVFVGAVFLFKKTINHFKKKEKIILTSAYFLLLTGLIFSKFSSSSILNGESGLSIFVYLAGFAIFLGSFIYVGFKRFKDKSTSIFKKINSNYMAYLIALTLSIIAARGGVRLLLVFGAISPIAVGFIVVKFSEKALKEKEDTKKMFAVIIALLLIASSLFTVWTYYQNDKSMAENYAPTMYTQQWQEAMQWVRENTAENSVFAHWWDYGYWVQSIGERATILDGGNAVGYWNHLMGRYVLTGDNEYDALEYLYSHDGTHLLIDPTDIGKYSAFSSIGSDENYDKYSWIPTIFLDESQTRETSDQIINVYPVGTYVDKDVILENGDEEILIPKKKAGVAAVVTGEDKDGNLIQPTVIFYYNEQQYSSKMRYIYQNGQLYDFGSGLESGVFLFPRMDIDSSGKLTFVENGAGFYLSEKTINSRIARLYLFGEDSDYFNLAYSQDNQFIQELKAQGYNYDFAYYQGFQGPIKIWEINYPSNIQKNEEYILTDYPDLSVTTIKKGEY